MFGLPTRTIIHPNDWVRPPGNTDFRVTQDALQHTLASPGHPSGPMALDIGDGNPDNDDLIAVHSGTVAQALTVGSANLSIDWSEGSVRWRAVYAHNLLPHPVKVGQVVPLGQLVGRMGKTGATAQHLHIQIGYLSGSTWVWLDPWPLIQNEGEVIDAPILGRITNRVGQTYKAANFRRDPSTSNPALAVFPAATPLRPDYLVSGQVIAGTAGWYSGMLDVAGKPTRGYFHESTITPLVPIEDSDCTAEVAAAVAPLQAQIDGAAAILKP